MEFETTYLPHSNAYNDGYRWPRYHRPNNINLSTATHPSREFAIADAFNHAARCFPHTLGDSTNGRPSTLYPNPTWKTRRAAR